MVGLLATPLLVVALLGSACSQTESCSEGEIRLVNGSSSLEGRVDLCRNGVWGSICDDSWDNMDASVVCRQVGRQLGVEIFSAVDRQNFFNQDSRYHLPPSVPIHLTQVRCTGREASLVDCIYRVERGSCSHYEDAGVSCIPNDSPLLPVCRDLLSDFNGTTVPFACPEPVNGSSLCLISIYNSPYSPYVTYSSLECNGETECGDCSDECHCAYYAAERPTLSCRRNQTIRTTCNCTENEFQCDNGYCVPRSWMCNQRDGCGDNSDETNQECIDLVRRRRQEAYDQAEADLGVTLGVSLGLTLIILLFIAPILALCMLVPQCPMRKLYSAKPMGAPETRTGEGDHTREGVPQELERSGAPLIASET